MVRKASQFLAEWHRRKNRKPLILRGARQVGKSTLVRLFAKEHQLDLVEVNLERQKIAGFNSESIDIDKTLQEIEYITRKTLTKKSLIFIDEIQSQPQAIRALRYFYEDRPDLAVIAAGSLLEFVLSSHQFSMPVGRIEYLHLGPMSFEEYLLALGNDKLVKDLRKKPIETAQIAFDKLSGHLREYYYIGGMPEAIKVFIEEKSFLPVEEVHRSIVETYIDDFPKYASSSESINLGNLLKSLPRHLGKKIKYSELLPEIRHTAIKKALQLLEQAKIVTKCVHSNASGIPLVAQIDDSVFKLYFLDVGLLNHLLGLSAKDILSISQEKLLSEGVMAEQFIAQHLQYLTPRDSAEPLFYWLKDKKKDAAEVDFLIQRSREMIPMEVKAGKSGTLKSLSYFMMEKKLRRAIRFDLRVRDAGEIDKKINTSLFDGKTQRKSVYTLSNYPLFVVEYLDQILG